MYNNMCICMYNDVFVCLCALFNFSWLASMLNLEYKALNSSFIYCGV